MDLAAREQEQLLLFTVAVVSRRRPARGLELNVPEVTALISEAVVEVARDGRRPDSREGLGSFRRRRAAAQGSPGPAVFFGDLEVDVAFEGSWPTPEKARERLRLLVARDVVEIRADLAPGEGAGTAEPLFRTSFLATAVERAAHTAVHPARDHHDDGITTGYLAGVYGDESVYAGGKAVREDMAQDRTATAATGALDTGITGVIVLDAVAGVVKGDVGIRDGRIVKIGKAGNPNARDVGILRPVSGQGMRY